MNTHQLSRCHVCTHQCFFQFHGNEHNLSSSRMAHGYIDSSSFLFVQCIQNRACCKRLLLQHNLIYVDHKKISRSRCKKPQVVLLVDRDLRSVLLQPWCQHRRQRHLHGVDSCEHPNHCVNILQHPSLYHCIATSPARLDHYR